MHKYITGKKCRRSGCGGRKFSKGNPRSKVVAKSDKIRLRCQRTRKKLFAGIKGDDDKDVVVVLAGSRIRASGLIKIPVLFTFFLRRLIIRIYFLFHYHPHFVLAGVSSWLLLLDFLCGWSREVCRRGSALRIFCALFRKCLVHKARSILGSLWRAGGGFKDLSDWLFKVIIILCTWWWLVGATATVTFGFI